MNDRYSNIQGGTNFLDDQDISAIEDIEKENIITNVHTGKASGFGIVTAPKDEYMAGDISLHEVPKHMKAK